MGEVVRPEVALAEAVVALAISDVLHGVPERRRRALVDIAEGYLDYWAEMVCLEGYGPEVLLEALHGLASRGTAVERVDWTRVPQRTSH